MAFKWLSANKSATVTLLAINWLSNAGFTITRLFITVLISVAVVKSNVNAEEFSLAQAQQLAISQDPNLKGNTYREEVMLSEKEAASYWENPQLSVSLQNLPTDGFSLEQEPMTQFKVGVKQRLPRGSVNQFTQQRFDAMASKIGVASEARIAWLKKEVALVWLDWYYATQQLLLLRREKNLLNQLLDVTESRYSRALDGAKQGDVVQVRLALLTLEDKHAQASQSLYEARANLSKWLGAPLDNTMVPVALDEVSFFAEHDLDWGTLQRLMSERAPFTLLQQHPEARLLKLQTQIEEKQLNIAREQSKSQWSVEASYSYRQDAQNGARRADFVSFGVQVDLPYFTQSKQEASIAAAAARVNASKTDFRLKVNALASQAEVLKERLSSFSQRKALYQNVLVEEVAQLAQTLLTSYTADTANFSEVVNAYIRQIQVQDALLRIEVNEAKTLSSLLYLYIPALQSGSHK